MAKRKKAKPGQKKKYHVRRVVIHLTLDTRNEAHCEVLRLLDQSDNKAQLVLGSLLGDAPNIQAEINDDDDDLDGLGDLFE